MDKEIDKEDFLEEFKKIKIVQKCPKCGELTLRYSNGRLVCSKCSYTQNMGKI